MANYENEINSWPVLKNGLHYKWLVDYAAFSAFGTFELTAEEWEKRDLIVNFKGNSELTTEMDGHGCYSGKDVHMLFVLARQRESQKIFRLIDEIDPTAFVSQSAVIGVYGEGFDRFKVGKKIGLPKKK